MEEIIDKCCGFYRLCTFSSIVTIKMEQGNKRQYIMAINEGRLEGQPRHQTNMSGVL